MGQVKAELKGKTVVLTVPVETVFQDMAVSASGKNRHAYSSHGFAPLDLTLDGRPVKFSLNLDVKNA